MQIRDAIEEYRFTILDLVQGTQQWYTTRLRIFADWCETQNVSLLEQITPKVLHRFLDYVRTRINPRSKQPIVSVSLHGYMRAIKTFYRGVPKKKDFQKWYQPAW